MPIADKIKTYSVSVMQNNFLTYFRVIRLSLESGGTAFIAFPKDRPIDWLQFALDLFGLKVGAVHTELDLSAGETPGEGDEDPQSLETLIRRARRQESGA